jgi:hypothetical protein
VDFSQQILEKLNLFLVKKPNYTILREESPQTALKNSLFAFFPLYTKKISHKTTSKNLQKFVYFAKTKKHHFLRLFLKRFTKF